MNDQDRRSMMANILARGRGRISETSAQDTETPPQSAYQAWLKRSRIKRGFEDAGASESKDPGGGNQSGPGIGSGGIGGGMGRGKGY